MVGSGRRVCEYNIENMMPESSTFRFLLVWFGLYPISKNVKHKHMVWFGFQFGSNFPEPLNTPNSYRD